MFQVNVIKIGKSLGFALPPEVIRTLKIGEGDSLFLTAGPTGAFLMTAQDSDFADAMRAAKGFMTRNRKALRKLAKHDS